MKTRGSAAILLVLASLAACGDGVDPDFDTSVDVASFPEEHARLGFDEAHENRYTSRGTYRPFAELLGNDGYDVDRLTDPFTVEGLTPYRVLVIAGARSEDEGSDAPAFADSECDAVEGWVRAGGGLLLVTDHFPCGSTVESLGRKFGVAMSTGMTFDEIDYDREADDRSQLVFSRENWLLRSHPVTEGRWSGERVARVVTFAGQSVKGPDGSALFMRHGATALLREARRRVGDDGNLDEVVFELGKEMPGEGWGQGVAFEHGRGRVVVLGEAAMLTALLDGERKIGMNLRGTDNRKLALNVVHWLSGLL